MPRRKTTSLKADPKLDKKFKKAVRKMGMDICFVEDCFRRAFLEGIKTTNQIDPKLLSENAIRPLVIHVDNPHFHYEVLRPRRRKKLVLEEDKVHVIGSPQKCAFCPQKPTHVTHNWPTRKNCNETYLCTSCFKDGKRKRLIQAWREL